LAYQHPVFAGTAALTAARGVGWVHADGYQTETQPVGSDSATEDFAIDVAFDLSATWRLFALSRDRRLRRRDAVHRPPFGSRHCIKCTPIARRTDGFRNSR
jgi:hypothetical protein